MSLQLCDDVPSTLSDGMVNHLLDVAMLRRLAFARLHDLAANLERNRIRDACIIEYCYSNILYEIMLCKIYKKYQFELGQNEKLNSCDFTRLNE